MAWNTNNKTAPASPFSSLSVKQSQTSIKTSNKQMKKAQIALEFLVIYSFVVAVFIIILYIVAQQGGAAVAQQNYASLQLEAQSLSGYIQQASSAGSGYSATIPIFYNGPTPPNITLSNTGVIIASLKYGTSTIKAYAFSGIGNLVINGTLVSSSSAISLYKLPIYTGSISIANQNGTIYVDEQPAQTVSLAGRLLAYIVSDVNVASFQGTGAYIVVNGSNSKTNALNITGQNITITAWVLIDGRPYHDIVDKEDQYGMKIDYNNIPHACSPSNNASICLEWDTCAYCSNANQYNNWVGNGTAIPNATFNKWMFLAVSKGNGHKYWYANGAQIGNDINTNSIVGTPYNFTIGAISPSCGCGYGYDEWFNGSISNVQIYNALLTPNQISALYLEGIDGPPQNLKGLAGWFPLSGNANDYSGAGNNGAGYNTIYYSTLVQARVHVISNNGINVSNDTVGFVSSSGSMGSNGMSVVYRSDQFGNATALMTSGSSVGLGNITVYAFNGNLSVQKNLSAWWPITLGYNPTGNTVFDLSGNYRNGVFNSPSWQGIDNGTTNFQSATFNGNGANPNFITINALVPISNIVTNDSFTNIEWVYFKGATPSHCQGIFGDYQNPGAGFEITGYNSGNCALLYINNSVVNWPNGYNAFTTNSWQMITSIYNGTTGTATVYINATIFANSSLPRGLSLLQILPYYVGDAAWSPSNNVFNGSIADIQLYSTAMSRSEISQLYQSSVSSLPINNAGLVGWWPLDGNANDYSAGGNNGVPTKVNFNNSKIANPIYSLSSQPNIASFNGKSAYISSNNLYALPLTNVQWIYPISYGSGTTNQIISSFDGASANQGSYRLGISSSGNIILWNGATTLTSSLVAPINRWSMVGFYLTQTTATIYLNSQNQTFNSATSSTNPADDYWTIGWASGASNRYFNGSIADVEVYNAQLTALEMAQLYQQGLPLSKRINVTSG